VRLVGRRAGRGSALLIFSDLLDLPEESRRAMAVLGSGRRALVVVQVLDPRERDLSFRGKVRLRAMEGGNVVVTDADAVRKAYLQRLDAHVTEWRRALEGEGGRLVVACTTDDPVSVVRKLLQAIAEVRR